MFRKIAEAVQFHRTAREQLAHANSSHDFLCVEYGEMSDLLRDAKAELRAVRQKVLTAEERAFWFEAENRDLRTKLGLPPKTNQPV